MQFYVNNFKKKVRKSYLLLTCAVHKKKLKTTTIKIIIICSLLVMDYGDSFISNNRCISTYII